MNYMEKKVHRARGGGECGISLPSAVQHLQVLTRLGALSSLCSGSYQGSVYTGSSINHCTLVFLLDLWLLPTLQSSSCGACNPSPHALVSVTSPILKAAEGPCPQISLLTQKVPMTQRFQLS